MRLSGFARAAFARVGASTSGGGSADATYIVQTADASLPNAQVLDDLAAGLLYNNASGVLASAALGSGLSGTTTITNDLLTGKAGGQTVSGGVAASEGLILQSTTHGTKGAVTVVGSQALHPAGSVAAPGISFAAAPGVGFHTIAGNIYVCLASDYPVHFAAGAVNISGNAVLTIGESTFKANGNGNLDFRQNNNPTQPTTFRVYNTTDGTITNYERGMFGWATANTLTIGAQKGGTGTLRAVEYVGASHSFDNQMRVPVGAAATPSYSFTGATGYGMWADTGNGRLAWSVAGASILFLSASTLTIAPAAGKIDFAASGDPRIERNGTTGTLDMSCTFGIVFKPGGVNPGNTSQNYVDVAPQAATSPGGATITSLYSFRVRQVTYTNSGADNGLSSAASVYIDGPPTFVGVWGTAWQPARSLWVASGLSQFSGNVMVTDGTDIELYVDTAGKTVTVGGYSFWINPTAVTIASGASQVLDSVLFGQFAGQTVTITGTTPITTATGFNYMTIRAPAFINATADIVQFAATLRLDGPPTISGGGSITNPYTLWIDSGMFRYDGHIANGGGGTPTFAVSTGGSGPAATNQVGWMKIIQDGANYFVPTWQ